jgi:hypothetical protein
MITLIHTARIIHKKTGADARLDLRGQNETFIGRTLRAVKKGGSISPFALPKAARYAVLSHARAA